MLHSCRLRFFPYERFINVQMTTVSQQLPHQGPKLVHRTTLLKNAKPRSSALKTCISPHRTLRFFFTYVELESTFLVGNVIMFIKLKTQFYIRKVNMCW